MSLRVWDALEERLAELVFERGMAVHRAVPTICLENKDAPVHYLVLVLASAASAMEDAWPKEERLNQRNLMDLYHAVAAVASDIAMHALTERGCDTCGQLLAHWQQNPEDYFDAH